MTPAPCGQPGASLEHRFDWHLLLLVWLVASALLIAWHWQAIVTQNYSDTDDLMRLLEVRDLLGGQSWFDLTQYRLDPPIGLHSHWSRLVDLPLVAVIAPLSPMVGQTLAETIASVVVPLLTLGLTMAASVAAVRRSVGHKTLIVLLVPLILVTAPPVLIQMFPTRIDHHGWQICLAAVALAALLDGRAWRSGLIAGTAIALDMTISIEALPYAVAIAASLALLWLFGREASGRLIAYMTALALMSVGAFVATAPTLRWTTSLCDVVKPAHLAVFAVAATGIALAARLTAARGIMARLVALAAASGLAASTFAVLAPECLGSPFGAMDPLVRQFWYEHVLEGLPVTAQPFDGVVSMVLFPLTGLIGAAVMVARTRNAESSRRWLLVLLFAIASFAVGLLVRRAAGVAYIAALPGVVALVEMIRPRIEAIPHLALRVPLATAMFLVFTPFTPIWAASAMTVHRSQSGNVSAGADSGCNWRCAMTAVGRVPAATMFTEVDVSPRLIATTHHKAYAGGYHRLEWPLHQTIAAFTGSPDQAQAIVCGGAFDYLLFAPNSNESRVYQRAAPDGFAAQLLAGHAPHWLDPVKLPTRDLDLYRIRRTLCQ